MNVFGLATFWLLEEWGQRREGECARANSESHDIGGGGGIFIRHKVLHWHGCCLPLLYCNSPHAFEKAGLGATQGANGVDNKHKEVGVPRSGIDPLIKMIAVVEARRVKDDDVVL